MAKSRILVVDHGMGNVKSVLNAVMSLGCEALVSSRREEILRADAFILPGVGAFGEAIKNLHDHGIVEVLTREVLEKKKPLLGICLGMQLLADNSEESGGHQGLGWIPARVLKLDPGDGFRIPHVGWSQVKVVRPDPLFKDLNGAHSFYFVHSYVLTCNDTYITAHFRYGTGCVAAVQKDNVFGTLFHPEKSSAAGLQVLRNFLSLV